MAIEKILILSQEKEFQQDVPRAFQKWGVDHVDVITTEASIRLDELRSRYNILIIDKTFLGNGRDTSRLVQRIRRVYFNPIIGFELHSGCGDLYSLQVAGCNFAFNFAGDELTKILDKLTRAISDISNELAELHQQ